jgi:hypothetical protein
MYRHDTPYYALCYQLHVEPPGKISSGLLNRRFSGTQFLTIFDRPKRREKAPKR